MNRITSLFGIQYPIIQGGMVWCRRQRQMCIRDRYSVSYYSRWYGVVQRLASGFRGK